MAASFFGSSPSPSVTDSTTGTGPDPADSGSAACTSSDSTGAASTVSAATSTGGGRVGPVAGAASRPAKTKARTEQAGNGILKATAHHPNAGEDQTAEADDSARIDGERFECPHERLS